MRGVSWLRAVTAVWRLALFLPLFLPTLGTCEDGPTTPRADLGRFYPVDLQASANQKRAEDFRHDNFRGNNLVELAAGKHQLLGIPFQVGDGILQLGSTKVKGMPEKIEIKVNRRFSRLHVLYAAAFSVEEGKVTIASYTLHYENGTKQTIPVVNRQDVFGWWKWPDGSDPSPAKVAWEGSNEWAKKNGAKIRHVVTVSLAFHGVAPRPRLRCGRSEAIR
jgi:hypothetical protein